MSLCFPISLASKRGGSVDLTEGLVRWWEDGDTTDKVSGTATINGLRGTKTLAPPAPFVDTFDPSRDAHIITPHMNNPATDFTSYTIFALAGRKGTGYRNWAGTGVGNDNGDNIKELNASQNIKVNAHGGGLLYISTPTSEWHTYVFSKSGNVMTIYKDGILVNTRTGTQATPTSWWRVWDCQTTSFAVWGKSDIPWTEEHAVAFHNGGNYVKYADL